MLAADLVSPAVIARVERIGRLLDDEAELRVEARRLELNPSRGREAAELFVLASRVREERLRLAGECGLT